MVETVTDCIRGCQIPVDDEGTLFVGAVARGGLLCDRCLARIGWLLDDAADAGARSRMALVPAGASSTAGGERVSGTRDPGLPLNAAAMDACDLLVGMLAGWVTYWARELQVTPPRALAAALAADRDVSGVKAGTSPETVATGVMEWGLWLRVQLPEVAKREAVAAFHDDLRAVVEKVGRQFPRESERRVGQRRPRYCPVCEMAQVWVTWPGGVGFPRVRCGSCQWEFDTDWGALLEDLGIAGRS